MAGDRLRHVVELELGVREPNPFVRVFGIAARHIIFESVI